MSEGKVTPFRMTWKEHRISALLGIAENVVYLVTGKHHGWVLTYIFKCMDRRFS